MKRILEICCTSLEDAKIASDNGADRIELCEDLEVGGVTPNLKLLESVLNNIDLPVFVCPTFLCFCSWMCSHFPPQKLENPSPGQNARVSYSKTQVYSFIRITRRRKNQKQNLCREVVHLKT